MREATQEPFLAKLAIAKYSPRSNTAEARTRARRIQSLRAFRWAVFAIGNNQDRAKQHTRQKYTEAMQARLHWKYNSYTDVVDSRDFPYTFENAST